MRVLILGVSGMLGHAVFEVLTKEAALDVYGASRSPAKLRDADPGKLFSGIDVLNADDLVRVYDAARPDVVVNAVGLIKQLQIAKDPLQTVPINTLLPHRLAALCAATGGRLIHMSTDCVFDGARGGYREEDRADATDLYGLSKYLGEVADKKHAITLRTSIIGRELRSANGLIEWFLNAGPKVKGYRQAVFSGFPTVVLAEIIRDHVLPRPELQGLFHVSADPINKYELLRLASDVYGLSTEIEPDDALKIDRSLNSDRFRQATGFAPAPWRDMLQHMRELQG